jgi:hypothetical protein
MKVDTEPHTVYHMVFIDKGIFPVVGLASRRSCAPPKQADAYGLTKLVALHSTL